MKKANVRALINEEELENVSGGNREIEEDTPYDTCELCGATVVIWNKNSMAQHQDTELCKKHRIV